MSRDQGLFQTNFHQMKILFKQFKKAKNMKIFNMQLIEEDMKLECPT